MTSKLSPAMSKMLTQAAAAPLPAHRYCANRTVKALERRGLVAYRYERGEYPWKSRVAEYQITANGRAAILPGLTDFLAALAQFADSSWTCPGCHVEQPEDTGCGDCGRCFDCCTCCETEPEVKYRDCLDWRSELYYSLIRL